MDKDKVMAIMNYSVGDDLRIAGANTTTWEYWRDCYYPMIIRESYPVYIRERSEDKGKKAFEIIKMLVDRKIAKINTVKQFIDAMDVLINVL